MPEERPQEKGGHASAQPHHGSVSAAEVEKYIAGIDFPCDKKGLIDYARQQDAPDEVLDVMNEFPDQQYGSAVDVARGVSDAKH